MSLDTALILAFSLLTNGHPYTASVILGCVMLKLLGPIRVTVKIGA